MGLIRRINHRRMYLDTNIFIYAIEAHARYVAVVQELFGTIDTGVIQDVTSELTLAEALVGPLSQNDPNLTSAYETAIVTRQHFEVVPVSR